MVMGMKVEQGMKEGMGKMEGMDKMVEMGTMDVVDKKVVLGKTAGPLRKLVSEVQDMDPTALCKHPFSHRPLYIQQNGWCRIPKNKFSRNFHRSHSRSCCCTYLKLYFSTKFKACLSHSVRLTCV